jgi:hypothetical protein
MKIDRIKVELLPEWFGTRVADKEYSFLRLRVTVDDAKGVSRHSVCVPLDDMVSHFDYYFDRAKDEVKKHLESSNAESEVSE